MNYLEYIVLICWAIFLFYWAINWRNVKPTKNNDFNIFWIKTAWIRLIAAILIITYIFFLKRVTFLSKFYLIFSQFHSQTSQIIGGLMTILGLIVAIVARKTLADNWSSTIDLKKGHELITKGIYKLIRHPIYAGMLLMGLGAVFTFLSFPTIIIFIFILVIFMSRIYKEEQLMTKTFPSEYTEYKKRTKALIPFIW